MSELALKQRYTQQQVLRQSADIKIIQAIDSQTQQAVILKLCLFAELSSWSSLQNLQHESALLETLQHDRLPRWIDWIEQVGELVCLVQSQLPAQDLKQILSRSALSEAQTIQVTAQVLCLLQGLHSLVPAVYHLDLKPSNLLQDEQGRVYLIDFGAARDSDWLDQATLGTPGFMPPEQLAGQPLAVSDLYALGATCIELLSGLPIGDLIVDNQIVFRDRLNCSEALKNWLEIMVHLDPLMRFDDAAQALSHLPNARQVPADLLPHTRIERIASSQAPFQPDPEDLPLLPPALADYQLEQYLYQQGGVKTWRVRQANHPQQAPRVLKHLKISQALSLRDLERLEAEISVLADLKHPHLPTLYAFEKGEQDWFVLLSELPGQGLDRWIENGGFAEENEIWQIARQSLALLGDLHQHSPPLLHGNLQPAALRWTGKEVYFVDMGLIERSLLSSGSGGSTLAGAAGYTSLELYSGQPQPASDLYALGMTLLFAVTGKPPMQFNWQNKQLDLSHLSCSAPLKNVLRRLTAMDLETRYQNVAQAQVGLEQQWQIYDEQAREIQGQLPQSRQARLEKLQAATLNYEQRSHHYLQAIQTERAEDQQQALLRQLKMQPSGLDSLSGPSPLTQIPASMQLFREGSEHKLRLPFASPEQQAQIFKPLKRAETHLQISAFFLPGLLMLSGFPFYLMLTALCWFTCFLHLSLLRRRFQGQGQDLVLAWNEQHVRLLSSPGSGWERFFWLPRQQKALEIDWQDLQALDFQALPLATDPRGKLYQLALTDQQDHQLAGPHFYLRFGESLWLAQFLPALLAQQHEAD